MASILEYKIQEEDNNKKLRDYLKSKLTLSTRLIRGAAIDGRIKINGRVAKLNHIIKTGDILQIDVAKEEDQNIVPEPMDLDIVHEDEDLIVINKPPFTVVHPTRSHQSGTLANGVLYHFRSKGENCIVRLVSRLDMDTSGLIVIAKNQYSHMFLAMEMEKNNFLKGYTAIAWGNISPAEGTINKPIYRPQDDSIKRVVDERGQESITHYEVTERLRNADIVKLRLETGRTHQIRVHLSHLGHPIIGDTLYGRGGEEELIKRQALHASHLGFVHPRTKEFLMLSCELPEDMRSLIRKLKEREQD
ncbi:RluA family pseudouridine synthase [Clostridium thermarum]|uniref:RluA family pseudouridine synthase n=1 Tax=Clostridium thermarum TaxID=1716543 RepID=UPI0013D7A9D9|nr:RluA family pseudouridine synthase [Clostridium thermarum]